jgi:hypothetical protein
MHTIRTPCKIITNCKRTSRNHHRTYHVAIPLLTSMSHNAIVPMSWSPAVTPRISRNSEVSIQSHQIDLTTVRTCWKRWINDPNEPLMTAMYIETLLSKRWTNPKRPAITYQSCLLDPNLAPTRDTTCFLHRTDWQTPIAAESSPNIPNKPLEVLLLLALSTVFAIYRHPWPLTAPR